MTASLDAKVLYDDIKKVLPVNVPQIEARREVLAQCVRKSLRLDGCLVELGVRNGGSLGTICQMAPNRRVYGFDSFEGLPEDWVRNSDYVEHAGFGKYTGVGPTPKFEAYHADLRIKPGLFSDTLPKFDPGELIVFLHVDCDLYSSTQLSLSFLGPMMAKGALVVFDELIQLSDMSTYDNWREGEWKALLESGWLVEPVARTKHEQVGFIFLGLGEPCKNVEAI